MLSTLRIENYAIVSFLELDFSIGMTAFTGETGAGKSIMIDALMLALGERADASVVRSGAEKCDITAHFHIDAEGAPATWLLAHDVPCDGEEILLRRTLFKEGRSKSYINGIPFPLHKIKELSVLLVDIHGQHQHQTLLHHATHREQLDQFAQHETLTQEVKKLYEECQALSRMLQEKERHGTAQDQLQFLQQQIYDLETLAIQDNEMFILNQEHQRLHHAKEYLEHAQEITELLQSDEQPSVCKALHQIIHSLSTYPAEEPHIQSATELMNNALIQCEEALNEIQHFAHKVHIDPERLHIVEERISLLYQYARKYQVDANQLPTLLASLQEKQNALSHVEEDVQQLKEMYQQKRKAYEEAALKLRSSRQTHAKKLEAEITAFIQKLGMPQGYIQVSMTPLDNPQAHGMDKVEYQVCTNLGMPLGSLSVVVSGGELSRIGLAIHVITAQHGATPTLVFDEVDVGIGGATAALVGQLLRQLGERLQLFCVTHQPQVAASAHHHFLVEKYTEKMMTFSRVTSLSATQKIDEIARMLGGITITEQSRSHAQELLEHSY